MHDPHGNNPIETGGVCLDHTGTYPPLPRRRLMSVASKGGAVDWYRGPTPLDSDVDYSRGGEGGWIKAWKRDLHPEPTQLNS